MNIESRLETITPDAAIAMLANNKANRPIKRQNLAFLCDELKAGRWQINGDAIRIAPDGTLIDGQHRLTAVAQTGITITTFVVTGVNKMAFETIDSGACRSNGDTLAVIGEKNTRNLAAALSIISDLQSGNTSFSRNNKIGNTEIVDLLNKNPDIRKSARWGNALARLCPPSIAISCHYLFSRIDANKADAFFSGIADGVGLGFDDAPYIIRQRLIENATSKAKLTRRYIIALMIKAWNAYRKGQKLKFLRFREEGSSPEPFPSWGEK